MSVTPRVNVIVEYLLEGNNDDPLAALPPILTKDLEMGVLRAPLLRELIVCHKASRTLLVADSGFFVRMRVYTYMDAMHAHGHGPAADRPLTYPPHTPAPKTTTINRSPRPMWTARSSGGSPSRRASTTASSPRPSSASAPTAARAGPSTSAR